MCRAYAPHEGTHTLIYFIHRTNIEVKLKTGPVFTIWSLLTWVTVAFQPNLFDHLIYIIKTMSGM